MNINIKDTANWEKSSMASGFSSSSGPQLNIKEAFSKFLPQPKNTFDITAEQISQMEADINMTDLARQREIAESEQHMDAEELIVR